MKKDHSYVLIMVTTATQENAEKIAHSLLAEKLIACANLISNVSSLFWWKNKIDETEECLLLMKSRSDLFEQVKTRVKSLHTYQVPEILVLPIVKGSLAYMKWIDNSLK